MINFNTQLEHGDILLRPLSEEDFDEMSLLCSDSEMWKYFTSDLSDSNELKEWMRVGIDNPNRLAFTVINKTDGRIMGSTSIGNISEVDQRAEIGWTWLGKEYQGKGINALVKYMLLKFLFEECSLQRVELKTDVLNIPARKAMKKIGLVEEGILRSHTKMVSGRRRDTIFYGVLLSEWEGMKKLNSWE